MQYQAVLVELIEIENSSKESGKIEDESIDKNKEENDENKLVKEFTNKGDMSLVNL